MMKAEEAARMTIYAQYRSESERIMSIGDRVEVISSCVLPAIKDAAEKGAWLTKIRVNLTHCRDVKDYLSYHGYDITDGEHDTTHQTLMISWKGNRE